MKAIQIRGAGDVVFCDVVDPEPQPGEVLIRVRATGICGTDVEIVEGSMGYFTTGLADYPIVPGHEWSGEIVSLGTDVNNLAVGDRVVGEVSIGCGGCQQCAIGDYHQCPNRCETGILHRSGGMAEFMAFPASSLHRVPADMPFATAAMIEPTAVAFNGVRHSQVTPRDDVAIFGDGPIGLLSLQVARAFGARSIVVVGATADRLAKASELGADAIIDVRSDDVEARLRAVLGGRLPNVIIDASGNPAAAQQAVTVLAAGGRLTILGLSGGSGVSLDLDRIVLNDLTVQGRVGSPGVWPDVLRLIEAGRVDPGAIISNRLPLSDFAKGIDLIRTRAPGVIKVIIDQTS